MPRLGRLVGSGLALLLIIAGSGCGPKVDFLNQDPGFDYPALSQGGIATVGGAIIMGSWDDRVAQREPITKGLESAFRKKRKDLRIVGAADVRSAVGADAYDDLMDGFDRSGNLGEEELATLDSLVGDQARYAAFARVEDSSVSESESSDTSDADNPTTTHTATRTVHVGVQVFDLQSRRSVWTATLTGSKQNDTTQEEEESGGFFADLLSGVVESLLGLDEDYPEAPTTASVLGGIFTKFAEELPHSE